MYKVSLCVLWGVPLGFPRERLCPPTCPTSQWLFMQRGPRRESQLLHLMTWGSLQSPHFPSQNAFTFELFREYIFSFCWEKASFTFWRCRCYFCRLDDVSCAGLAWGHSLTLRVIFISLTPTVSQFVCSSVKCLHPLTLSLCTSWCKIYAAHFFPLRADASGEK